MDFNSLESTDHKLKIILSEFLRFHPKLIDFIFDVKNVKLLDSIESITQNAGRLSSGEQILVGIVLHLWTRDKPTVNLWLALKQLDQQNFKQFIKLLIDLRYKL